MRETLVLSAVFTVAVSAFNLWRSDTELLAAAALAPLFFAVMFFTMRASNRIGQFIGNRWGRAADAPEPEEEPGRPPRESERPEHARRRRRRGRRRRGRGRRG